MIFISFQMGTLSPKKGPHGASRATPDGTIPGFSVALKSLGTCEKCVLTGIKSRLKSVASLRADVSGSL